MYVGLKGTYENQPAVDKTLGHKILNSKLFKPDVHGLQACAHLVS